MWWLDDRRDPPMYSTTSASTNPYRRDAHNTSSFLSTSKRYYDRFDEDEGTPGPGAYSPNYHLVLPHAPEYSFPRSPRFDYYRPAQLTIRRETRESSPPREEVLQPHMRLPRPQMPTRPPQYPSYAPPPQRAPAPPPRLKAADTTQQQQQQQDVVRPPPPRVGIMKQEGRRDEGAFPTLRAVRFDDRGPLPKPSAPPPETTTTAEQRAAAQVSAAAPTVTVTPPEQPRDKFELRGGPFQTPSTTAATPNAHDVTPSTPDVSTGTTGTQRDAQVSPPPPPPISRAKVTFNGTASIRAHPHQGDSREMTPSFGRSAEHDTTEGQ
uniref:Uncharacterized protein n=1 Tax=Vitrella brassicaformis TaxID=1169539 RepID=A0A7S1JIN8_9ALVE|mmetsp:Transcript_10566/g.25656  ORF Transcript_10566/g.25656 Transcript_10566/m.25656 type:complete len:322 (+) Transcript_10566:34-999(+)